MCCMRRGRPTRWNWPLPGVTLDQTYPSPLVMHQEARERTLQRYSVVKKNGRVMRRSRCAGCLRQAGISALQ